MYFFGPYIILQNLLMVPGHHIYTMDKFVCLLDGVQRHFQQYFNYIMVVSFIGGGNLRGPGENHQPVASH
jgi:hypothetical protein